MNINQRVAFARAAQEEDAKIMSKRKPKATKNKRKVSTKMKPVSRKGKNKFTY
jgi:hypothetical protein